MDFSQMSENKLFRAFIASAINALSISIYVVGTAETPLLPTEYSWYIWVFGGLMFTISALYYNYRNYRDIFWLSIVIGVLITSPLWLLASSMILS